MKPARAEKKAEATPGGHGHRLSAPVRCGSFSHFLRNLEFNAFSLRVQLHAFAHANRMWFS